MIDTLQNTASVILDIPLTSIEQSIYQRHRVFTHALSSQANTPISSKKSIIQIIYTDIENGSIRNGKLTKALPDLPIFANGKDPSINQWFFKMKGKFKINWDHYFTNRSKLIYA